jgi:hypothetical protein
VSKFGLFKIKNYELTFSNKDIKIFGEIVFQNNLFYKKQNIEIDMWKSTGTNQDEDDDELPTPKNLKTSIFRIN